MVGEFHRNQEMKGGEGGDPKIQDCTNNIHWRVVKEVHMNQQTLWF